MSKKEGFIEDPDLGKSSFLDDNKVKGTLLQWKTLTSLKRMGDRTKTRQCCSHVFLIDLIFVSMRSE